MLEMISKYDAINYEFVHLVYESIFFIVCSPNFKIRTCCGPTLPRLRGKLELQTRGRFGGKRDKKSFYRALLHFSVKYCFKPCSGYYVVILVVPVHNPLYAVRDTHDGTVNFSKNRSPYRESRFSRFFSVQNFEHSQFPYSA